jgi:hypothetical protein
MLQVWKLTISQSHKLKRKTNTMKLFFIIATLATLLFSVVVHAKDGTTPALRGNKRDDNYFALITSAGTQAEREIPGCVPSALSAGNVVAMVRDDRFCIKLSYDQVSTSRPELFSHTLHGPAATGETGPVIFTMDATSTQMQCFELTADQKRDLDDELWYIHIHSQLCLKDDIRGQILPLISNVGTIVQQLRQNSPPAETASVTEQARI